MVMITGANPESLEAADAWVRQLTREVKAGEAFTGKVTRLMEFGAFVEVLPKIEGLVHISEMAPYRVGKVGDIVKVGDTVNVIVHEIDSLGRVNLSMKRAEGNTYPPAPADTGRPAGGDRPRPPSSSSKSPFGGGKPFRPPVNTAAKEV
jgi:polyribonucleotide nucleotidyltransferase